MGAKAATPTPKEIEDATAEIRESWSETEYRKRASFVEELWEVPTLRFLGDTNADYRRLRRLLVGD